ncbi:MAG: hypothetical protein WCI79_00725 [Candidatus Saccharibacteria bacterium]
MRQLSATTLLETLKMIKNKNVSEKYVKELWQTKLSAAPSIYEKGWYEPPPDGFAVLACDDANPTRLDFSSLREEYFYPQSDVFLSIDSVNFLYCSPVDRASNMIGDFGITLYGGNDQKIIDHIQKVFTITKSIADHAQIGMELREVYEFGLSLFDKYQVTNLDYSQTDGMNVNIGHTIPWTYDVMTAAENNIASTGNWDDIKNIISKKRKFISKDQDLKIPENIVFTIEPKLKSSRDPNIPSIDFHMIVVFRQGKKTVIHGFDDIFSQWDMNYLVKI